MPKNRKTWTIFCTEDSGLSPFQWMLIMPAIFPAHTLQLETLPKYKIVGKNISSWAITVPGQDSTITPFFGVEKQFFLCRWFGLSISSVDIMSAILFTDILQEETLPNYKMLGKSCLFLGTVNSRLLATTSRTLPHYKNRIYFFRWNTASKHSLVSYHCTKFLKRTRSHCKPKIWQAAQWYKLRLDFVE